MSSNFLEAAGTNGFIATPFNLLSTELNALGTGLSATSTVGGTSGVFNQVNNANGIWGSLYFVSGGTFTPAVGAFLAGWFLRSPDGGSTFETATATASTTVQALSRSPDFTIPLDNAVFNSGNIRWCQGSFVMLPWESYSVILQNMSGGALPTSGNLIKVGPTAIAY